MYVYVCMKIDVLSLFLSQVQLGQCLFNLFVDRSRFKVVDSMSAKLATMSLIYILVFLIRCSVVLLVL